MEDGGFTERLYVLNEKARNCCRDFLERVRKIGVVTTTALVLGTTSPAYSFAEEQVVEPPSSDQTVNEFAQIAQVEKKEALPSYDRAMKSLHESVMTDTNEKMLVSVREEDGVWKPIALTEGNKTSIASPEEETDAREKGEEMEEVHTHPLEVSTFSGLLSPEEIANVREGNGTARVLPPSGDGDFLLLFIQNILAKKTGARIHYKVVEPTGEWSFEIADQDAPYIVAMEKVISSIEEQSKGVHFSAEEKEYIESLKKVLPDPRFFQVGLKERAASSAPGSIVRNIWDKLGIEGRLSHAIGSLNSRETASFGTYVRYLGGNPNLFFGEPDEQKNKEDIEFYETTAKKLGFSLKYTPNKKAE